MFGYVPFQRTRVPPWDRGQKQRLSTVFASVKVSQKVSRWPGQNGTEIRQPSTNNHRRSVSAYLKTLSSKFIITSLNSAVPRYAQSQQFQQIYARCSPHGEGLRIDEAPSPCAYRADAAVQSVVRLLQRVRQDVRPGADRCNARADR